MNLITERLILRDVTIEDLAYIHELHSLPETDQFNTLGIPSSIEQTRLLVTGWIEAQNADQKLKYTISAFHKDSEEFTGLFGINVKAKPNYRSAEIWYKLHPKYWNKGLATEAVQEILRFCFNDLSLHRIEAGCAVENLASIRVLEKTGFTREGRTRKLLPIRGEWVDNYFYAILEEDLPGSARSDI